MGADPSERDEDALAARADEIGRDDDEAGRIERLIEVLEAADGAFRSGSTSAREHALADALSAIGALYGFLDDTRSPETSAHLAAVYDASLRALGDAYGGDVEALTASVTMARAIRSALRPAPAPADVEAPRGSRTPGMRRAA